MHRYILPLTPLLPFLPSPPATCAPLVNEGVTTKNMYFYKADKASSFSLAPRYVSILALPHSKTLGNDVSKLLSLPLTPITIKPFSDGESNIKVDGEVRGKEVFVICSTCSNQAIIESLLTVSLLRRASAKSICMVMPYHGYSRLDMKKSGSREPIAAADVANMFDVMGVDSVILMDIHNDSLRGFYSHSIPADNLETIPVAAAYFNEQLDMSNVVVCAPHEGQVNRASDFRKRVNHLSGISVPMAFISKSRQKGTSTGNVLVGDVSGRDVIVVDDIIDTGSTMLSVVNLLKSSGARSVRVYATHALLTKPENIKEITSSPLVPYLLVSNTVYHDPKEIEYMGGVKQLSVAPLLAEAIRRTVWKKSVSGILNEE